MSVHSRRAAKAVLDRLEAVPTVGLPILHWFSGTIREMERAGALGCWFSVGPAMLRSEKGRALTARMPKDRILTESDGPFAQIGDRPALPWDAAIAQQELASLWQCHENEVAALLSENLKRLLVPTS